jgi:hypothetical protein
VSLSRAIAAALPALAAGLCSSAPDSRGTTALTSVVLRGVPHREQRPDFCGEACAAMWLAHLGKQGDQDFVFERSGVDPLLGRGAHTRELESALRKLGFDPGQVWTRVRAREQADLEAQFRALHADLSSGVPSIVCMRTSAGDDATEHFRLVLGYDAGSDEVLYHEPAEADGAYRRMPRSTFLDLWPLHYARDTWTLIRMRLDGRKVTGGAAAHPHGPADYAQHVMELKKRLPRGFSIAIARPFVVIGDIGADQVRWRARNTVEWAVSRLKKDYFQKDPDEIIDVWLFANDMSYRKWARALFGDEPDTPFGYYSPQKRALVMNIGLGGGTLVHEIVHPYVRANFPEAPAWLNEGLGSLYEQSMDEQGRIVGRVNWRLPGLQAAIRAGRLPSFAAMTSASDEDFYAGETSYAQARYLLYYLQEEGLLARYYRLFFDARRQDPTGLRTLQALLGEREMDGFQRRWEEWVLTLRQAG